MISQSDKLTLRNAYDAATVATDGDTAGNAIDTQGYKSCTFVLRILNLTDGTYTLGVEESDASGSGFTDVSSDRIIGTPVALNADDEHDKIGVVSNKRYLRMTVTAASTTSGADVIGHAILGNPEQAVVPTHDETA